MSRSTLIKGGLYKPRDGAFNPLTAQGRFSVMGGWQLRNGVLRLAEGIEQAFPNLLIEPQDFSNVAWTKSTAYTPAYGQDVDPLGELTAVKLTETVDASAYHYLQQVLTGITLSDSASVVFRAWVKCFGNCDSVSFRVVGKDNTHRYINVSIPVDDTSSPTLLVSSGVTSYSFRRLSNGFVELTIVCSIASGGTTINSIIYGARAGDTRYTGDTGSGVIISGPQLQAVRLTFEAVYGLPFRVGQQNRNQAASLYGLEYWRPATGILQFYSLEDQELNYITESGAIEAQVSATFFGSALTARVASAKFRDRILFAATNQAPRWLNPSNNTFRALGVSAPSSVPTAAAGTGTGLTGTYKYTTTFVDDQGHEGNPYISGTTIQSGSYTAANEKISLSSIPLGPTGIAKRRIYRTRANGATFLYLTEIADNTTTTYANDDKLDSSLGSVIQTDNDTPPTTVRQIFTTATRVYLVSVDGKTLYASKIDPFTADPAWQAYPDALSLELPFGSGDNAFQAVFELNGFLYATSRLQIYRIQGDIGTGVVVPKALDVGFFGRFAWTLFRDKVVFLGADRKLYSWDGAAAPVDIGADIQEELDSIQVDSGLNEVSIIPRGRDQQVSIFCRTSGAATNHDTILHVDPNGEGTHKVSASVQIPLFIEEDRRFIGSTPGTTILLGEAGRRYLGGFVSEQAAELYSFTPYPGRDAYCARICLQVSASDIIAHVPPSLKVEVALNDGDFYTSRILDLSSLGLVRKKGQNEIKKTVYVPVFQRAESFAVRVTPVANSASIDNDIQVYMLWAEIAEEDYKKDKKKQWFQDRGTGT